MRHRDRLLKDEEIYRANDVRIMEYIQKLNLQTKRAGKTLKVEGYGGLYIDPANNRWNCFSKGKGGGPIQLVMFLENKSWLEAVKTLLDGNYESKNISNYGKDTMKIKDKNKEFILPKKNKTFNHVIAYLIKTRGIDKDIIYKAIQNKTLYEDEKRNCVFVGYDKEGKARYGGLRGTNTNKVFKGEVENSNKAYSFNIPGKTNKLYIFESPIELMSYLTLQKRFSPNVKLNDHMLSLGCLATLALEKYIEDNPNIKELNLCLNNDKWGINAAKNIRQEYQGRYRVNIEYPKLKDFNDVLIHINKGVQNNSREIQLQNEEIEEYELEL